MMEEQKEIFDFAAWAKDNLAQFKGQTFKQIKDELVAQHSEQFVEDNKVQIQKWLSWSKANQKRSSSKKDVPAFSKSNVVQVQNITEHIPTPQYSQDALGTDGLGPLKFELKQQKKSIKALSRCVQPLVEQFGIMKKDYDARTEKFTQIDKQVTSCLLEQDGLVNKAIDSAKQVADRLDIIEEAGYKKFQRIQKDYTDTHNFALELRDSVVKLELDQEKMHRRIKNIEDYMVDKLFPILDGIQRQLHQGPYKRRKILIEGQQMEVTVTDFSETISEHSEHDESLVGGESGVEADEE